MSDSKSKLIICIPCLCLGGTEFATLQMIQALKGEYEIKVICYYEYQEAMLQRYKREDVEVCLLNRQRKKPGGLELIRLFGALFKLFKVQKPDVVHVQYIAPGMIPIIAAKIAGIKNIFATIHTAGRGYGIKSKFMLRISSLMVNHFFCVSKNVEKFWLGKIEESKDNIKSRYSAIYNGVDLELFSKAKKVILPQIAQKDIVIGAVGRLVKLKGYDCLLKAISGLSKKYANLKVLIIGEGSYNNELKKLGRELGIDDNIIWLGKVEPENLPGYYKCMDIFVVPSHYEGFGFTAAEAMAAGIPVLGSRVPGLIEVIGEDGLCGRLFSINDANELAKHLQELIENDALRDRLANSAMQRAKKMFDKNRISKKWQEKYSLLLRSEG